MNDARLDTIEQTRTFFDGTADVTFAIPTEDAALHSFLATVLKRFQYFNLTKGQPGTLFACTQRVSGYTRQYVSNLIAQYRGGRPLQPLSWVAKAFWR